MNVEEMKKRVCLSEKDVKRLEEVEEMLPLIANLVGGDVFIDCQDPVSGDCFVVGQAASANEVSAYRRDIRGELAEREKEPAVYHVMEKGFPIRDIKTITQEARTVSQSAAPIINEDGDVIGVLISERNIDQQIKTEQKYKAMRDHSEKHDFVSKEADGYMMQELYHRLKNHIQQIVSVMNMQARESQDEEVKSILSENITRMLNMCAVYEMFMDRGDQNISLLKYLDKLKANLARMMDAGKNIEIILSGDEIFVPHYQAIDIGMVVNELVTNAYKYAFADRTEGSISIILNEGQEYSPIIVQDDGHPHESHGTEKKSVGMRLVKVIVDEKLGGRLYVTQSVSGTTVAFDFKN